MTNSEAARPMKIKLSLTDKNPLGTNINLNQVAWQQSL